MLRIDKLIFIIYAVLYPTISSATLHTYLSGSYKKVNLDNPKDFYISILSDPHMSGLYRWKRIYEAWR